MKTPVIGIPLDSEEGGGYSALPWYALRKNYAQAVAAAGGLPLCLPHETALVEAYLDRVDGLLVTGGAFDIDPVLWGAVKRHPAVTLKSGRTDFELAITRAALTRDRPILGICGGEQLLGVALGGTLVQHIPDEVPGCLPHEQPNPRTEPGHAVRAFEGTLLRDIARTAEFPVNSAHHQAIRSTGGGSVVSGMAPDSVIEAIEHPGYRFCLGVQWHPEYHISPVDKRIFEAFVGACRT